MRVGIKNRNRRQVAQIDQDPEDKYGCVDDQKTHVAESCGHLVRNLFGQRAFSVGLGFQAFEDFLVAFAICAQKKMPDALLHEFVLNCEKNK